MARQVETEIGHLYTKPDGTFRGTYTFLRGNGTETYKLWAKTARERLPVFAAQEPSGFGVGHAVSGGNAAAAPRRSSRTGPELPRD